MVIQDYPVVQGLVAHARVKEAAVFNG